MRPRVTCSGAAYFGVNATSPSRVMTVWTASVSSASSLAMPKSSSLTSPAAVTSTFDGLRSRWMIRLACACATADCTSRTSRMRSSIDRRSSSQYRSMWRPSMCSRTRYGWPAAETPASMRRAMWGWVSRARIVPSRLKRASPARPTSAAFSSFSAACPSNRPSLRSASQTLPMPPWPIADTRR